MATILCMDDCTLGMSDLIQILSESGYQVLAAADRAAAIELASNDHVDAVILNCHREQDNAGLVTALRILQPHVAVVMFSGYCDIPCYQLHLADACIQKERTFGALIPVLRAVLCQSRYGLCRAFAA
jgi:DNA-binding NarL/FixJ family response regulator